MNTYLLTTETEFKALKKEWSSLHASVKNQSPFLTWEWMYQWWQSYATKLPHTPQLSIITSRDSTGALQSVWPLFIGTENSSIGKIKILKFIGTEFESSDYLDIIADSKMTKNQYETIINSDVFKKVIASVDKIIFKNVLEDSIINRYKSSFKYFRWQQQNAICPFITLPADRDDLLNSLSKNMKSSLRRTFNKLQKDPDTRLRTIDSIDDIDRAVKNLFDLHGARFDEKEENTKFIFETRGAFHQEISKIFLEKKWLKLYEVLYKDTVIGSFYCYHFSDILMYVQAGFNPDFSQYALGNQLILHAISDAINLNCTTFDFMRGDEAYKYKWTSSERYLYTLEYGCSGRGKVQLAKKTISKNIKKRIHKVMLLG